MLFGASVNEQVKQCWQKWGWRRGWGRGFYGEFEDYERGNNQEGKWAQ